jgi:hypothetical protein
VMVAVPVEPGEGHAAAGPAALPVGAVHHWQPFAKAEHSLERSFQECACVGMRRRDADHSRRGMRRRTGRGRRLTCAGDAAASLAAATRCAWARAASNSEALLARAFAIFWRQARCASADILMKGSRLFRTKRRHAVPPIAHLVAAGLHGRPSQIVRLALSNAKRPPQSEEGVSHFVDALDPILAGGVLRLSRRRASRRSSRHSPSDFGDGGASNPPPSPIPAVAGKPDPRVRLS